MGSGNRGKSCVACLEVDPVIGVIRQTVIGGELLFVMVKRLSPSCLPTVRKLGA